MSPGAELFLPPVTHHQDTCNSSVVTYCNTNTNYFWNFIFGEISPKKPLFSSSLLDGAACPLHIQVQHDTALFSFRKARCSVVNVRGVQQLSEVGHTILCTKVISHGFKSLAASHCINGLTQQPGDATCLTEGEKWSMGWFSHSRAQGKLHLTPGGISVSFGWELH